VKTKTTRHASESACRPRVDVRQLLREKLAAALLCHLEHKAKHPGFFPSIGRFAPEDMTTAKRLSMTLAKLQTAAADLAAEGNVEFVPGSHGLRVGLKESPKTKDLHPKAEQAERTRTGPEGVTQPAKASVTLPEDPIRRIRCNQEALTAGCRRLPDSEESP
jgi:hypothetical protein